jgi:hypothetical protein
VRLVQLVVLAEEVHIRCQRVLELVAPQEQQVQQEERQLQWPIQLLIQ